MYRYECIDTCMSLLLDFFLFTEYLPVPCLRSKRVLQYFLAGWIRIRNAKVLYYQDQKGEVNPGWELAKWCLGLSSHTLPAIALGMLKIKPVLRFYFGLLRLRAFEIPPAPLPIFCSKALLIVYKSQLRLHS